MTVIATTYKFKNQIDKKIDQALVSRFNSQLKG
jgi:hypothetical protein